MSREPPGWICVDRLAWEMGPVLRLPVGAVFGLVRGRAAPAARADAAGAGWLGRFSCAVACDDRLLAG